MRREPATEARLTVQVHPRAARDEIVACAGMSLRVRVTAPPAGGAANDAVRQLIARTLRCPSSAVEIVRGHSARTKLLRVLGLSRDEVRARLEAFPSSSHSPGGKRSG